MICVECGSTDVELIDTNLAMCNHCRYIADVICGQMQLAGFLSDEPSDKFALEENR